MHIVLEMHFWRGLRRATRIASLISSEGPNRKNSTGFTRIVSMIFKNLRSPMKMIKEASLSKVKLIRQTQTKY